MSLKEKAQELVTIAKKYGYSIKNSHSQDIISQFSFGTNKHNVLKREKENNIFKFKFDDHEKAYENKYVVEILTYDEDNPLYIGFVDSMASLFYLFFEEFEAKDFYENVKHFKVLTKKDLSNQVVHCDKKRTIKEWINAKRNYIHSEDNFLLFTEYDLDEYNFSKKENKKLSALDYLKNHSELDNEKDIKKFYLNMIKQGTPLSVDILNALCFIKKDINIEPYLGLRKVTNIYNEKLNIETLVSINDIKTDQVWINKETHEEVCVYSVNKNDDYSMIEYSSDEVDGSCRDHLFVQLFYMKKIIGNYV